MKKSAGLVKQKIEFWINCFAHGCSLHGEEVFWKSADTNSRTSQDIEALRVLSSGLMFFVCQGVEFLLGAPNLHGFLWPKGFFIWTFSMQSSNFCLHVPHLLKSFFFPRIPLLKQHWIRDVFVELLLSFCARQVFLLNGRTSKQFNQRQLSNRKIVFPLSATRFGLPWLVRAKEQSIGWNSKVWSTCLWDMNLNTNQANTIQKPSYTTNTICKKVQSHFLLYGKKA